jgi:para-aminobenzoate synthetase component I
MTKTSLFKKALSNQSLSHQEILESLNSLNHVVFLNNNNNPLIGLCASEYVLVNNSTQQKYQETQFNDYQISDSKNALEHFIHQFNEKKLNGLIMGFIGYDYSANLQVTASNKNQPNLFLGCFPSYLSFETNLWFFNSSHPNADLIFERIDHLINQPITKPILSLNKTCKPRWTEQQYSHAFNQVQEYIKAGDCYQINLTQEFQAQGAGSLLSTLDEFFTLTEAPYSGYLRVQDFELLSCSPELFIDFEEHHKIVTKPIKGTMPRYNDPIQDELSKTTLKNSEKDQAENVMIVDLLRNDLSVYAEVGSVKTPKLFNIESFNQVHHMVSEVEAILKPNVNPFDVLISALPGGSITGAPKIRAMQIIEELEQGSRGAYCGSMGYFNNDGTGSWNILIRSIQKNKQDISLWAGGGITIASNCEAEYQECFDKVEALVNLLNTYNKPQ